ncbi:alpha/beta fold hydrolase [Nocardia asiatica]|uniref:alpha/beta hydrolase n=1 Tax=Nocardia asiatica TaxID=209252 RepID=UPI003EE33011
MCAVAVLGWGRAAAEPGLERFERQIVAWRPCGAESLDAAGAQCADIVVPVDYAAPGGATITIAVSRTPASDPARRRGVLLTNPGGPGASGLDPAAVGAGLSAGVRAAYDSVGFDPRGIGRSAPVRCGWAPGGIPGGDRPPGRTRAAYDLDVLLAARLAAQCVAVTGGALTHVNTRNTARDMRIIATVLGEPKISYYGTSYGSYLGAVFTQMFPEHSDRIVLDSVVDPERYWLGSFQDVGAVNEAALDDWAAQVGADHSRFQLGDDAQSVRRTVEDLLARVEREPIEIAGLHVDEGVLLTALNLALSFAHLSSGLAQLIQQLRVVADGGVVQPAPIWEAVRHWVGQGGLFEAHMAVKCGDVAAPRDPEWYWRNIERSRVGQPVFGPLTNHIAPCAFWPPPIEPPTVVGNSTPALLLQADGDIRTPYAGAQVMRRALTEARLVTLRGVRWHGVLGLPSGCLSDAVDTYLLDGSLPAADVECRLD